MSLWHCASVSLSCWFEYRNLRISKNKYCRISIEFHKEKFKNIKNFTSSWQKTVILLFLSSCRSHPFFHRHQILAVPRLPAAAVVFQLQQESLLKTGKLLQCLNCNQETGYKQVQNDQIKLALIPNEHISHYLQFFLHLLPLDDASHSGVITFLKQQPIKRTMYRSIATDMNRTISLSGNHLIYSRKNNMDKFLPL